MPELLFSPRRAEGPVGTGVHLLRLTQGTDGIERDGPAYGALTFLMGSKIAELAGLFGSVGAIVGTLGWLDETRDRVPFWVALRAMASATRMR
jgi:hypothetical protein